MTGASSVNQAALVFRVGARVLAARAAEVAEVARRPPLTLVPQAPAALAGLCALKGRVTPVIELARLLGEPNGGGAQLLVLRGETPMAVAVDLVEGIRDSGEAAADWLDLRRTIAELFQQTPQQTHSVARSGAQAEARAAADGRELSFLEFSLAGERFAFPIAEVRAVAKAPVEITSIPGADSVVLGVAPYGDGVLPVVEVARLLGLAPAPPSAENRLFVVEIGGAPVGLRVERALGALRLERRAVSAAPAVLNRGAGEARVTAIARTPAGLTAILATERLFDEATTRRLNELAVAAPERPLSTPLAASEAFVVFRLGEERYALPAAVVEAVGRPARDVSAPPNAPSFLAGAMSYRGETIPLVDLRKRFGASSAANLGAAIFVKKGAITAGLLVDGIERLARIPHDELERSPPLAGDAGALFAKVAAVALEGRPLLVVDAESLFSQARRDLAGFAAARPRRGRS